MNGGDELRGMKSGQKMRLASGGAIERSQEIVFSFNGVALRGHPGDTLASALLANGIILTARSFRYHRPRGIFSAGVEENQALLTILHHGGVTPNVRASRQMLYEGLTACSQNCWPGPRFDLGAISGWLSRFMPVGFYYKTFMWPQWRWWEPLVRKLAGTAPAPQKTDRVDTVQSADIVGRFDKRHAHCDLLIVGAGPAGLAAARAAAQGGSLRMVIVDSEHAAGGSLHWQPARIADEDGLKWADRQIELLNRSSDITILRRTTAIAAYDHGHYTAIEQRGAGGGTLWHIRARHTILASGAIERPLVFPNNDRPGIMLADAARHYVNRFAVKPGSRAVIFTNNDSAYQCAVDLHRVGIEVAAMVDVRADISGHWQARLDDLGIEQFRGFTLVDTRGYLRLRKVKIHRLDADGKCQSGSRDHWIDCDLLCSSGGWSPTAHLYSQAGGKLEWNSRSLCFVPANREDQENAPVELPICVGAANGQLDLAGCMHNGHQAGLTILRAICGETGALAPPETPQEIAGALSQAHWHTPPPAGKRTTARQWVDMLHDVTADSIEVAAREGFVSVEHMKRYTTTGMAIDQGKTGNVNALGLLGHLTGRDIGAVGTTTFRPPYLPVSLGAMAGRETGSRFWPQRRLPAHEAHIEAGGVMEDHGGWSRAACYRISGETEEQAIRREVRAARESVALLDSSSLGKLEVRGTDALEFLNRMYVNRVETLNSGRIRYGMMLNENGIIVDDGVFARLDDDRPRSEHFLVSTSSSGATEVALSFEEWLQTEWPELDVVVNNITTQWATFTISGPRSREVLATILSDADLSPAALPHMSLLSGAIGTMPYRLMRVSFSGELSFELNVPAGQAHATWDRLLDTGQYAGITPLGMEALDILRVEKGYLEVGVDTDGSTCPLDVGWGDAIAKKTGDFVGRRSLARSGNTHQNRLQLVGLRALRPDRLLEVGAHLVTVRPRTTEGHVTSSCISPTLDQSVALAMLCGGQNRLGQTVCVDIEGERVAATVVPMTFYDPGGLRLSD